MAHRPLKMAVIGSTLALLAGCNNSSDASPTTAANTAAPTTTVVITTATSPTSTTTTSATTTTTSTTVTPATTPAPPPTISIPAGVPSQDEITNIAYQWFLRVDALYASPNVANIDSICVPQSQCAAKYTPQIADAVSRGEHVIPGPPLEIAHIRGVIADEGGGFTVSMWTGPVPSVTLTGPDRTVQTDGIPEGIGSTLSFVSWPADPNFPWRVTDDLDDPK